MTEECSIPTPDERWFLVEKDDGTGVYRGVARDGTIIGDVPLTLSREQIGTVHEYLERVYSIAEPA